MTAGAINSARGGERTTRVVRETTKGQTPSSAAWLFLRNKGGAGVSVEQEEDISQELTGVQIGTTDIDVVSQVGVCAYTFDLSKDDAFEAIFESFFGAAFGDTDANKLYAGNTFSTLTVEDEWPSVREARYVRGVQVGSLQIDVEAGRQILTGQWTGRGADTGINSLQVVTGSNDISLAASTITVGGGLPSAPTPSAGDLVLVRGATTGSNNGLYVITGVSGNDVTVNGTFVTESNISAVLSFTGQSQFAATSGTGAVRGTAPRMRSGADLAAEFSFDGGSTWESVLQHGLRFSRASINATAEIEELHDIQETDPYASMVMDKVIEVTIGYHMTSMQAARFLDAGTNIDLRLSLLDSNGEGYRLRFPKLKSQSAQEEEPSKGSRMSGEWALRGLLDANDRDFEIERV